MVGGFDVGGQRARVLCCGSDVSNWSDALAALHESLAGRRHPIDLASRSLAVDSMRRIGEGHPIVIDLGCSLGPILEDLHRSLPHAHLIGADYLLGPLEKQAERLPEIPFLQFDLRKCPLPDACVDGVTCLNVLEHIDDDVAALGHIFRIIRPGGVAHIELPAGPGLYDIYDQYLMHHRRYKLGHLLTMARRVGFVVERATHLGFFAYPGFWAVKKRNRRRLGLPPEDRERIVASQIQWTCSSRVFGALVRLELALGRALSYPWGIRCIAILRKPAPTTGCASSVAMSGHPSRELPGHDGA